MTFTEFVSKREVKPHYLDPELIKAAEEYATYREGGYKTLVAEQAIKITQLNETIEELLITTDKETDRLNEGNIYLMRLEREKDARIKELTKLTNQAKQALNNG